MPYPERTACMKAGVLLPTVMGDAPGGVKMEKHRREDYHVASRGHILL